MNSDATAWPPLSIFAAVSLLLLTALGNPFLMAVIAGVILLALTTWRLAGGKRPDTHATIVTLVSLLAAVGVAYLVHWLAQTPITAH